MRASAPLCDRWIRRSRHSIVAYSHGRGSRWCSFGVFAAIALAVSAVGLYAIVAYAITQRTREIGVRVALGAESVSVARLILGASARLVITGGCIGLLGAYAATRAMTTFLYDLSPTDPFAFGGAVLVLVTVAFIASFIPMRRALQIDPMEALRAD